MCKRRKLFLSFLARHDASGVIFALFSVFFTALAWFSWFPQFVSFMHVNSHDGWPARAYIIAFPFSSILVLITLFLCLDCFCFFFLWNTPLSLLFSGKYAAKPIQIRGFTGNYSLVTSTSSKEKILLINYEALKYLWILYQTYVWLIRDCLIIFANGTKLYKIVFSWGQLSLNYLEIEEP